MTVELPSSHSNDWEPCSVLDATQYFVFRDTNGAPSRNYPVSGPVLSREDVPKAVSWMIGTGWHLTDQVRVIPIKPIKRQSALEVRAEALRAELNKLDEEIARA